MFFTSIASSQIFPARQVFKLFEVYGNRGQNLGSSCAGNFDLNRDGKPDFAVGTLHDTTQIYFGGKDVLDTLWNVRLTGGGGQNAIVSGDFDGDGFVDIVNSGFDDRRMGNFDFGGVYYYRGINTSPFVDTIPYVTIIGDTAQEFGKRLAVANLNGDKYSDLIVYSYRNKSLTPRKGVLSIYLGSKNPFVKPPIHLYYKDTLFARYSELFTLGDLNGDTLSDLLIWSNQFIPRPGQSDSIDYYLEIFYGKKTFSESDTTADVVFHSEQYPFIKDPFSIVDLNGDHIDDICFLGKDTLLFQLCKREKLKELGPFEKIPNPDAKRFTINSNLFRIGDYNGDGYEDFMTIIVIKDLPGWFFSVYLCGPHWYTQPAYYYLRGGSDLDMFAYSLCGIGDINGDGGDEFLITKPMGEMRNDFFSYNDGYFVVVKSDTLLRLGVNDFPQHSTKYMLNVYPNPTLNKTTISFQLINHEIEKIRVSLYDIFGRKIYDIYEGELRNGAYSYQLNTSALFSGLYFINLVVGSKSILKKIINIHN